jgi:hypothetical protein
MVVLDTLKDVSAGLDIVKAMNDIQDNRRLKKKFDQRDFKNVAMLIRNRKPVTSQRTIKRFMEDRYNQIKPEQATECGVRKCAKNA